MSTRTFLTSALLLVCTSGLLSSQSSGNFVNGNFETGDYSGWTQGQGLWSSPGEWPTGVLDTSAYLPGGNKYQSPNSSNQKSTVLTDPVVADPRTDGHLMPIYNGHHTAKVNDEVNDYSVSVISQTVANYSSPQIYFAWAAVLQASHSVTDSDNFTLKLTDDTTHTTLREVTYNSANASTAGLFHQSNSNWFYTEWQVESFDVSARVGHTFTLSLLASDCPYGGHAGYVYLDGFGSIAPPTGTEVGNENGSAPLSVSSIDLGTVSQGSSISGSVSASGGVPPYTFSTAGSLPAGISGSGSSISGTAGAPGSYSVTVVVTDSAGSSAAGSVSYTVFGLTTTSLSNVIQFSPYLESIGIAGGTPPYSFNATGLPPGLSISSSGVVQGIARTTGSFNVALTISDSAGHSFSTSIPLQVVAPLPLRVTSNTLPSGTAGAVYSNNLMATGGAPPYSFSLASGSLPQGLTFHTSGSITGVPTTMGTYSFVVRVTDVTGASVTGGVSLVISPLPLTILNPSPFATGYVGISYPVTMFGASGGIGPYTFSIGSGSLPSGLTLSSAGLLSGVPTSAGTATFTVNVTDSAGHSGTAAPFITIQPYNTTLALSAGSLVFNAVQGSATLPSTQSVGVQSTNTAIPIHYTTTITPATANWLTVTSGGTTPGTLNVSLNDQARQLAGGTTPYQATVNVNCVSPSPCAGSSQPLVVALNVTIVPPALSISSDLISFSAPAGSAASMSQLISVQNTGGGSVGFASVTCGAAWCSVSGAPAFLNSGISAPLNITANPAGLISGFYRTTLEIRASTGSYSVPVTLFVAAGAGISIQPSGTQFTSSVGGVPVGALNSFYVESSGSSSIAWTASVLPGSTWLNVNTPSGSSTGNAPGVVNFSINPAAAAGLSAGAYYGRIRVIGAGIASPQDFEVVLNVAPASTPQVPNPSPQGLLFITSATTPPPPQSVQIATGSALAVGFQASASTDTGGPWLSINASSGTAAPGNPAQTLVSVNPTGLTAGVYTGGVSYAFAGSAVRTVNVTLIVLPAGATINGTSRTVSGLLPHAGNCAPKIMVPAQVGLVNNFSAPTAWPTPLMLQVMSDCGDPVTNAQVVATFSNGDSPIALSLANPQMGIYSATWTPHHASSQVTVNARASAPGLPAATTTLSGAVTPNNAPLLTPHSTLHVFDPEVGAGLGPGTIVQMYGDFLAPQTTLAPSIPLATQLSGTSVIIGGIPAPLYFVSPGQINAQIPFELQPGQQYQVIVNANGALTTPDSVQLTPVSPGLAALPDGTVIAQHSDGKLVSETSPAKPGEFLVMYVAGLGTTDTSVTTGAASPTSPLAHPQDVPTLTIGGQQAQVLFAGLTPGLVGLYQVNFQVPSGAPNGDLTLVLSQTAAQSNSSVLPVHN